MGQVHFVKKGLPKKGAGLFIYQLGQKCLHLQCTQCAWMAPRARQYKAPNPAAIGLLRPACHIQPQQPLAHLIQQSSQRRRVGAAGKSGLGEYYENRDLRSSWIDRNDWYGRNGCDNVGIGTI